MVDALLPGSSLGRYQIMERIGRGGMASVYRARDPQLNRNVAVKVFVTSEADDPTFVERFRQEAQAVARLNHSHIIQVHDFGEDKGFSYIVMELLTGGTLNVHLGRSLPLSHTIELLHPLARALDYAHGQGVIHSDLKPANVLLDTEGIPKLSDFGLARLPEGNAGLTRADSVIGTPEYQSPEQALGQPADKKSDLYALGIITFQMLLGRTPFRGETPSATLMAHIHQAASLPTALDPDFDLRLESILLRSLAKDPDDRYEPPGEFLQTLSSVTTEIEAEIGEQPTLIEHMASPPPVVSETVTAPPTPKSASPTPEAARARRGTEGERRIITVLFCDVVSSTAMAERLDPEEWTEIMNEAFQYLTAPITRYEGTVARLMGDAVLAFFGAPVAHEDDPQRAILAALDIVDGIRPFREQINREYGLDFNVRVGINTGPVVVGDIGSAAATEYTAMGDAVNVAARMEQMAEPGTIQVSGETYRLVAPLFECEGLGETEVRGKSGPVPAYKVLGARAQPGRLRGIEGLNARLIGRDREFAQLKDALEQLRQGRGQIVCVIGEAGLGKSRLLEELYGEWVQHSPPDTWTLTQGISYDSSRPYSLFQKLARDQFGIELDDPVDVIHQKVDTGLRGSGLPDEAISLCSVALERVIAAKVLHEAPDFPADVVQRDIYEQMYQAWHLEAATMPVVMVVDDLHWADQASVELLMHLFQLTEEVPILFLCAFRPERQSSAWQLKQKAETDYPHRYTEVAVHRLGSEDAHALVSDLLNIADLPADLLQLILRKAEGNPYFVEEVVRSLIDQGVVYRTEDGLRWQARTSVEDITIPNSLLALLASRIDRLDQDVRATLQLAAVIGRSFYYRILNAISTPVVSLDKHLSVLQRLELVREAARVPELAYMFKHELARDAAYSTILHRRRRELHRHVGKAIEALFPDKLEENAHRLAHHFAEVGDDERALKYYTVAADSAVGLHANAEAAAHFGRAIEAAQRLGVTNEELSRLQERQAELLELSGSH